MDASDQALNDELYQELHDVIDQILREYFHVRDGIQSDRRDSYAIPPEQVPGYDVTIDLSGHRYRGRLRRVYVRAAVTDPYHVRSVVVRQIVLQSDVATRHRDLRMALGREIGVYSMFHGFLENDQPCEPPSVVGDLGEFRNFLQVVIRKLTGYLARWRDNYYQPRVPSE